MENVTAITWQSDNTILFLISDEADAARAFRLNYHVFNRLLDWIEEVSSVFSCSLLLSSSLSPTSAFLKHCWDDSADEEAKEEIH